MASSMGGNYHRDGGTPQNSLWAFNCQPEPVRTRRMRSGPTEGIVRPVCEPDPYVSITTFSYGDGGGVKGTCREIDNTQEAQYILISEDVVGAHWNAR